MSNLRDLLPYQTQSPNYKQQVISVYNGNTGSPTNGGACCCFIVPPGNTWAIFELWGGGGDGAGACCCMGPYWGPGGGNYAKKYLSVAAGCYFILCGAGSGCCATQCCGNCGFPSFVLCGSNQSVATCAGGGQLGCVLCHRSYQACTGICIGSCSYGCTTWGADYSAQSNMGPNKESNYCWSNMWVWDAGSYKYKNSTRRGLEYCSTSLTNQGCNNMQGSKWPGGPGQSARACGGGCCWGGWGAGGLAMVTYG